MLSTPLLCFVLYYYSRSLVVVLFLPCCSVSYDLRKKNDYACMLPKSKKKKKSRSFYFVFLLAHPVLKSENNLPRLVSHFSLYFFLFFIDETGSTNCCFCRLNGGRGFPSREDTQRKRKDHA